MAATKPRTGDGPLEVTKEPCCNAVHIPADNGGRLAIELNDQGVTQPAKGLERLVEWISSISS